MFTALKVRRAAAHLTTVFPEIPIDVARRRARTLVSRYPHIRTDRVGEFLVHGEERRRWAGEIG
ncbi:hypothetical protein [Streptomyces cyaneofuscatus]